MGEETRIRIKRNGWEFELRTELSWVEVMDRCQRDFGGKDWIGGPQEPKPKVEKSGRANSQRVSKKARVGD
jgi:hypothetical protein